MSSASSLRRSRRASNKRHHSDYNVGDIVEIRRGSTVVRAQLAQLLTEGSSASPRWLIQYLDKKNSNNNSRDEEVYQHTFLSKVMVGTSSSVPASSSPSSRSSSPSSTEIHLSTAGVVASSSHVTSSPKNCEVVANNKVAATSRREKRLTIPTLPPDHGEGVKAPIEAAAPMERKSIAATRSRRGTAAAAAASTAVSKKEPAISTTTNNNMYGTKSAGKSAVLAGVTAKLGEGQNQRLSEPSTRNTTTNNNNKTNQNNKRSLARMASQDAAVSPPAPAEAPQPPHPDNNNNNSNSNRSQRLAKRCKRNEAANVMSSSHHHHKKHLNKNNQVEISEQEECIKVQLFSGTLYLYRGGRYRRAEFIRRI